MLARPVFCSLYKFDCLCQALRRKRLCPEIVGPLFDSLNGVVELWLSGEHDHRYRRLQVPGRFQENPSSGRRCRSNEAARAPGIRFSAGFLPIWPSRSKNTCGPDLLKKRKGFVHRWNLFRSGVRSLICLVDFQGVALAWFMSIVLSCCWATAVQKGCSVPLILLRLCIAFSVCPAAM